MITFDPATKIIQLDTFSASEKTIWSAYVDWSVLSDNLKYGVGVSQLGGVAPIALYIFLELGWRVRPLETDGVTTISGNLLVQGGGSPITATVGSFQTLVNMETPVAAVAIETGVSGLTPTEASQLSSIDDLKENQVVINDGIKNASLIVPHVTDVPNT